MTMLFPIPDNRLDGRYGWPDGRLDAKSLDRAALANYLTEGCGWYFLYMRPDSRVALQVQDDAFHRRAAAIDAAAVRAHYSGPPPV